MTLSCMQAFMARDPLAKMGYKPQLIASFVYVRIILTPRRPTTLNHEFHSFQTVLGTGATIRGGCPGPCVLAPDGLDTIDSDSIDLETVDFGPD